MSEKSCYNSEEYVSDFGDIEVFSCDCLKYLFVLCLTLETQVTHYRVVNDLKMSHIIMHVVPRTHLFNQDIFIKVTYTKKYTYNQYIY